MIFILLVKIYNYCLKHYKNKYGKNIHSDIFKKYRNNDYAYDINEYYAIIGCEYFKDDINTIF